ncbi:major capsid protein [Enterobacter mori]|nr:major capsid protein [Enterobacter mori]
MLGLYTPAALVRVVSAEDIQKQLKTLCTDLFFTRAVTFEKRDIILDTIDDPNIPIAAVCSPMVGSKLARDEGYESKPIRPGYMRPKSSIDPNKQAVRPAGVTPEQYSSLDARNLKVKQAILKQSISIRSRIEWLAVQAVTTGENIIEGEGIERYELDWKIKSQNMSTQAGGAAWSGTELIPSLDNDYIHECQDKQKKRFDIDILYIIKINLMPIKCGRF